jgi:hypothetical protein
MRGKLYPLMKRVAWLMGACGAFVSESGHAQELEPDWISARHAGMGFATAATSNDSEAGFANPAGLARMRNPRSRSGIHEIQFPKISVLGSEADLQKVFEALASKPEQAIEAGARNSSDSKNSATRIESRMYPSIVLGGKSAATWLIGLSGDLRTSIVHSKEQTAQTFDIKQDNTIGAVLGVAGSSRGGTFSYGVSVRPNARYFQSKADVSLDSVNTNPGPSAMSLPRTIGIGLDAGILFTAADFWLPTVGLAVRNLPTGCASSIVNPYTGKEQTVCGTLRTGSTTANETRTKVDPMDLRLGVSMTPRFRLGPERLNLRLAAEASPLAIPQGQTNYGAPDVPLERMLKVGTELYFGNPRVMSGLAFRGGIYLGEPTWGMTISLWFLNLEYASFVQQAQFRDKSLATLRQHLLSISTSL